MNRLIQNRLFIKNNVRVMTNHLLNPSFKSFSTKSSTIEEDKEIRNVHFKGSGKPHPLVGKVSAPKVALGDHSGLQQNHIWTENELKEKLETLYHHKPQTFMDKIAHGAMFTAYHTFNFISGYNPINPTVKAIEWRLIALESLAGVPGFVAAGFRHFRSLRSLKRDYGWIPTLLEEAENERMHLLVCLSQFQANFLTRAFVIALQGVMVPALMAVYLIHPKSLHRFVGYLEETACETYVNIINHVETPGTHLHQGWSQIEAPDIAIGYWRLPSDAKWVDCLKCMMADETHHRDVNHTFADMKDDDPNPFLHTHKQDALHAWRLHITGESAWGKNPQIEEIRKATSIDSADNVQNKFSNVKKF